MPSIIYLDGDASFLVDQDRGDVLTALKTPLSGSGAGLVDLTQDEGRRTVTMFVRRVMAVQEVG